MPALPPNLAHPQKYLTCGTEAPENVNTQRSVTLFDSIGVDTSLLYGCMQPDFKISILSFEEDRMVFEMDGIDVSLANAFRRILLAEIPCMAFETVQIWQNTGVIHDEVLAHRLGLIPIKIDPSKLNYRKENEDFTDTNSVKFKLHVKCQKADLQNKSSLPVYSGDFVWVPMTEKQKQVFGTCPPCPVRNDILITKLVAGQEIELLAYAEKGIGQTHMKWSPVCTAVYRQKPSFEFPNGNFQNDEARELKELCPKHVFDIEDSAGVPSLYVKDSLACTTCRICVERFPKEIKLLKKKDTVIFTIESTGALELKSLFESAVDLLEHKCQDALTSIEILKAS